jgi:DNA processing protein
MEEKIFANAFNQCLQIGPVGLKKIKEHFGSFKDGWNAPFHKLKKITGIKDLEEFRKEIDPEKEFKILEKEGIKILLENEFPALLKEIFLPPQILYIKGSWPSEKHTHLAVVGTRKFSSYGKEVCEKMVSELSDSAGKENLVIVSGLALGIDSIAHKTALANGMQTIAVLGSGLHKSILYPQTNLRLAREIIEKNGCIISEYPLTMKAAQFTFPQRNRIVAGLSQGALVIEAPERSGALITAFLALEFNREVFSVPGGIFGINSKGTNNLLKVGALPVTRADDILRALGIEPKTSTSNVNLSPAEEKIISMLYEPLDRDELIRKTNLMPQQINPVLTQMEIKGIIKEIEGKLYKI